MLSCFCTACHGLAAFRQLCLVRLLSRASGAGVGGQGFRSCSVSLVLFASGPESCWCRISVPNPRGGWRASPEPSLTGVGLPLFSPAGGTMASAVAVGAGPLPWGWLPGGWSWPASGLWGSGAAGSACAREGWPQARLGGCHPWFSRVLALWRRGGFPPRLSAVLPWGGAWHVVSVPLRFRGAAGCPGYWGSCLLLLGSVHRGRGVLL